MAYRNGTYIAFAADGQTNPTLSDIKYYNILKCWHELENRTFNFVNSHDKVSACRDSSSEATIKRSLRERLKGSKRFLLLVGNTTRLDDDFVPYEINYAIKECNLPVIVCYVNERKPIFSTDSLEYLWPSALVENLKNEGVRTLHIPFCEKAIVEAIKGYDYLTPPPYKITVFTDAFYKKLGIQ